MASGLFALLDDVAAIAKAAAASIDDVAVQAIRTSKQAAGIVIDDAAVTPRYVVGAAADRELPIIARIAWGSFKNKTLYLLPGALALSLIAPWAITPLLMIGGGYLCFEGYEKVHAMLHSPAPLASSSAVDAAHEADAKLKEAAAVATQSPAEEDAKVAGAIRTDFILSAEIMAISLAGVTELGFAAKAATLGIVGLLVTVGVYGVVALIVKADDFGVMLAQRGQLGVTRSLGRGIVSGMPGVLKGLSVVGTIAMLWVGGGIILHGLDGYGLGALPHGIHDVAKAVGGVLGPLSGVATWLVDATAAGLIGLAIGWLIAVVVDKLGYGH